MPQSRTLPGLAEELAAIKEASLWKTERPILTAQGAHIRTADGRGLFNFCANNYLGLANHPALIAAAKEALDSHGLGMASVRFICGTSDLHRTLETRIAAYVGQEDSILFRRLLRCQRRGLRDRLLAPDEDAIISDSLNHASIIDGIRLSKAARFRYRNADLADLERQLQAASGARRKVIVTDGVFSMDGYFADLVSIRALADRYDAL